MGSLRAFAVAIALAVVGAGCGGEPPPPAPTPTPAAPAPVAQKAAQPAVAAPPEAPPPFVYDPTGLRDPFEPFLKLEKPKPQKPKVFVPKTPLQRYAVEELRLVGVVWSGPGRAKALIEDPEGKGYVVGSGTLVGDRDGKIVDIRPEKVVVEERSVDLLGEENVKMVTMTLRKPEGEVSP